MKHFIKLLVASALIGSLTACAVVPANGYYDEPRVVVAPQPHYYRPLPPPPPRYMPPPPPRYLPPPPPPYWHYGR